MAALIRRVFMARVLKGRALTPPSLYFFFFSSWQLPPSRVILLILWLPPTLLHSPKNFAGFILTTFLNDA